MFQIDCHACGTRRLVGTRSIASLHHTADGPLAYVRCPCGHTLVRYFRDARGVAPATAA